MPEITAVAAGYIRIRDNSKFVNPIPFFMGENIIGRSEKKATIVIS